MRLLSEERDRGASSDQYPGVWKLDELMVMVSIQSQMISSLMFAPYRGRKSLVPGISRFKCFRDNTEAKFKVGSCFCDKCAVWI